MAEQAPNYYNRQEIENLTLRVLSRYFQAKTNLQTGNVTEYYYNSQLRVIFDCPQENQTSCEGKSDQRIHMDHHNQPPTESVPHHDQTCVVKCDTPTPKINSNQLEPISRHNMENTLSNTNLLTTRYRQTNK